MPSPSLAALAITGVLAVTSLAGTSRLYAQAASSRFHPDSGVPVAAAASQLNALSHERAARWARSGHVLHCGPAPLTERPGIESEFARPHVVPLESAFVDAARVKRSVALLRMRNER